MSSLGVVCGVCTCFIVVPSAIMIAMSFASLPTVEYGLDYNAITMSVDNKTFSMAGLYFLGLGHSFIKFPRVIQTIEFNQQRHDLLHTRTSDGLPLTLGVSFQFRYIPQHLHTLYLAYKGEHLHVYENTATAVIANVACNYSAYTFFNDKQGIAAVMQSVLAEHFEKKLFAQIDALQINYIELPSSFQDAILESIATKQNITRSVRYKENMQVTFETQAMVARQRKNQTIIEAAGLANRRTQQALANAKVTEQEVLAEMNAFGNISEILGLLPTAGLDYIWWDSLHSLAANGAGKEFLVGVNPQVVLPVES
jgi:regulator of protease activity HflC (stomatin/prohibitin superfamily)